MIGKHPKPSVLQLYQQGHSTRAIARQLGVAKSYVGKLVKDAGISRDRAEAVRMVCVEQPSTNPRTCRAQARRKMARKLGRLLQRTEEVHHRDGDYTNNADDNLELLGGTAHRHIHCPPNPVPRHLRHERREYMRTYLKNYRKRKVA